MEDFPEKKPFWNPSYAKPIVYTSLFGIAVFVGLSMAVKAITPPAETKLQRGWPVSGKYFSDTSVGRRNSWGTKIGEEYVVCVGSAYGGKTDCEKSYEGRQVVAVRAVMPSLYGDRLVIAELREGSRVLYSKSDAELLSQWEYFSFSETMLWTGMVVILSAMFFSVLVVPVTRSKKT